jgi:hypothetical protein
MCGHGAGLCLPRILIPLPALRHVEISDLYRVSQTVSVAGATLWEATTARLNTQPSVSGESTERRIPVPIGQDTSASGFHQIGPTRA